MKKNMGTADKVIRIIVAAIILGLYAFNVISGTLTIVLLAVGIIFILTSMIGFCPLYLPFGINTAKKRD